MTASAATKKPLYIAKKNGFWAGMIICIILIFILYNGISRIAIENKSSAPPSVSDSRALALYAESLVRQAQSQPAKELAIMALSKSLANSRAIRTLAQSNAQEGRNDTALALFQIGGRMSWRDSETQLALFETAVKNADIKSGLDNMDALLRRNVAPDEILSIYLIGGQDDNIAQLIAEKLAQNPSWRERFFTNNKWDGADNMDSFERIISHLKQSQSPPKISEINQYSQNLTLKKSYGRALNFWQTQAPQYPAKLDIGEQVVLQWAHSNRNEDPYITDWRMNNIDDVYPYFEDDDNGQSARANFDIKKRANGLLASRWIIMPRSDLKLKLQSSNAAAELSSSLQWIVKCIDSPQKLILDPLPRQEKTWSANISALNCDAHILEMHVNPLGISKDIEIVIDNVTITSGL